MLTARHAASPYKKWIKLIPKDRVVPFALYARADDFTKVVDVTLDTSTRKTHLALTPLVDPRTYRDPHEWIYLLVVDGDIVKIGGTRDGLRNRLDVSYGCGRCIEERGGSGKCSVTNAFVYNTLVFYAEAGSTIEVYGRILPPYHVAVPIFGTTVNIKAQVFHGIESTYMEDFRRTYGFLPFMSDNSDPAYRKRQRPSQPL